MRLAGIDIGTLTCRLLIAETTAEGLSEVHADRRILRLGEAVDQDRRLGQAAMNRVIATLQEWRVILDRYRVDRHITVATSAVRDASNSDEFLSMVKRDAGLEVEVLTGEEEARRTMLGLRAGLPSNIADVLGLDIGGGSTEFILDRRGAAPVVCSIDLGVVRLTERVFKSDPPTAEQLRMAGRMIVEGMRPAGAMLDNLSGVTLVGTAGTVTTLAAMAQRLRVYDAARVHQYALDLEVILGLEHELTIRTRAERRTLPGLEAGREDVVIAGTVMLRTIMQALGFQRCVVSHMGLREGVLIDLAQRMK